MEPMQDGTKILAGVYEQYSTCGLLGTRLLESNVHISRTLSSLITLNHCIWRHPMRIWWHQATLPDIRRRRSLNGWCFSVQRGIAFGLGMSIGTSSNYGQAALNRWWYAGCPCFDSLAGWTLGKQVLIQMSSCACQRILALAVAYVL